MPFVVLILLAAACALVSAPPASAAPTAVARTFAAQGLFTGAHVLPASDSAGCAVKDRSKYTALVICPPGTDDAALEAAGREACQSVAGCHAYIWTDAEKAPDRAPSIEHSLSKAQADSIYAVWADREAKLILCTGTGC